MSNIYIESFKTGDKIVWGLFFDKEQGVRKPLEEDFKQVCFDTENEARAKLEDIEKERLSEDGADPFSLEEAETFVTAHTWKFASTYAKTAPHEYLVKKWLNEEDCKYFERFKQTIDHNSVVGYFYGHKNDYFILGDHYYWYLDYPDNMAVDLINRTTTDYLEYRDGAYYYKGLDYSDK